MQCKQTDVVTFKWGLLRPSLSDDDMACKIYYISCWFRNPVRISGQLMPSLAVLMAGFHRFATFMLKWSSFRGCETQTLERQKDQLLKFQCNEVNITETVRGNQTQMLLERQGNMPKMHSWCRQFFMCKTYYWPQYKVITDACWCFKYSSSGQSLCQILLIITFLQHISCWFCLKS